MEKPFFEARERLGRRARRSTARVCCTHCDGNVDFGAASMIGSLSAISAAGISPAASSTG
jgi:hypothetical protein